MSDGLTATHGAAQVRQLQRALYRTSQQDKKNRFDSRYDQVWRADGLWEAGRQVQANHGAPGVDGMAIARISTTGYDKEMIQQLHEARRAPRYPCAPVQVVEMPKPTGGTRPLGRATVEDRVVQTARTLVLEPIFEADVHDGSDGSRTKREAKQASMAMRADLDNRAWGVVGMDVQAYCTRIPPRTRMTLMTRRSADGSRLKLSKQTLTVGAHVKGQGVPTQGGGPQGAPLSPVYSTISLHRVEPLWQRRGDPAQCGATLHRYADDAILGCRSSPQPGRAACEGSAKRRDGTINRAKTRVTRGTDGFDCIGFHLGKRQSPRSGKPAIDIVPAKSAQQKMRHRLQ